MAEELDFDFRGFDSTNLHKDPADDAQGASQDSAKESVKDAGDNPGKGKVKAKNASKGNGKKSKKKAKHGDRPALFEPMVLRGMNPQVIAVDEITAEEDIRAMCLAANCGVGLLASIHAASVEELHQKPLWQELLQAKVFRRCIVIHSSGGARSYEVGELPCSD